MNEVRVLFIGNSHTHGNDLTYMVKVCAEASGAADRLRFAMLATGGKTFGWHAEQSATRQNIVYGEYDFIVLQTATSNFPGEEETVAESRLFKDWLAQSGAKPVLYLNWSKKDELEQQDVFTRTLTRVAKELGGVLAPVGEAWRSLRNAGLSDLLYQPDGNHATPAGSYVAACTLCAAMFGKDPLGFPYKIKYPNLLDLDAELARRIQEAARDAVTRFPSPDVSAVPDLKGKMNLDRMLDTYLVKQAITRGEMAAYFVILAREMSPREIWPKVPEDVKDELRELVDIAMQYGPNRRILVGNFIPRYWRHEEAVKWNDFLGGSKES